MYNIILYYNIIYNITLLVLLNIRMLDHLCFENMISGSVFRFFFFSSSFLFQPMSFIPVLFSPTYIQRYFAVCNY